MYLLKKILKPGKRRMNSDYCMLNSKSQQMKPFQEGGKTEICFCHIEKMAYFCLMLTSIVISDLINIRKKK